MLSVVTLLLAAFVTSMPASRDDGVERGPSLPAPSFCAELEAPPVLLISADEEDLMPFEDEQSCAESEVLQPYDIEAPVDTI